MDDLFASLISDLCVLLDSEPPGPDETAIASVRADVDGAAFLISRDTAPPGLLTIHRSLGPLGTEANADTLLRLLNKNLALASRCAGTLAVDAETGELIYTFAVPLGGLSASQLLQGLRRCAHETRSWHIHAPAPTSPVAPLSDAFLPFA